MKKINFSTFIHASREKVWDTMLEDATYREWTEPFNPAGSYYKGSWDKGSEILFLGVDTGTAGSKGESGMYSRIAENRLHEFISIEHLGLIKDGVKDTESDEAKQWVSAHENYTFTEKDGSTELFVEIDTDEKYASMFEGMWPKALEKLKELAEK